MFDLYHTASEVNQPGAQEVALRARKLEKQQAVMVAQYKAKARTEKKRQLSVIEQIILLFGLGR